MRLQRHRAHRHPRPWPPRGAARRRGAAAGQSPADRLSRLRASSGIQPVVEAFRQGLRELGYVEGQNIVLEYRWAEGQLERLPALAAELVRLKVDVIVTDGTPAARAAKDATRRSPLSWRSVPRRSRPGSSPAWRGRAGTSRG